MEQKFSLIEPSDWINPTLCLADEENVLTFHIQDAFNYHGYDAVGGVVLGFRLLQKAIDHFSKLTEKPLQRRLFSLLTAFPGLGARDCFELVTRMSTEHRLIVNTQLMHPNAQEGVEGQFYFEFMYEQHKVQLAPISGYPGDEFTLLGKASKKDNFSPTQAIAWRNAKFALANTLLSNDFDSVIRTL